MVRRPALLPPNNNGIRSYIFVAPKPSAATVVVVALLVCVGAPFFEELFFRGVVQGILTRRIGAIPAIAYKPSSSAPRTSGSG